MQGPRLGTLAERGLMNKINAGDPRFFGATDSETIQNAVDFAKAHDLGQVTIPRFNERTGRTVWDIEKAILLPDDMTVIIDDAHLRMADGVFDNIFRNERCYDDEGCTMEGEQHDIRIIGVGNALLDGGELNGLTEQYIRDHPDEGLSMNVNLTVQFHNVRNFELRNLNFRNTRYWAVCFTYCRWGKLIDLDFRNYGTMENQDGIDLRVGCEYFTIENITGITGDDTIALTALAGSYSAKRWAVKGKKPHIHDVSIRNVISASHGCSLLRFLCEDGSEIYNVTVDGLKDTGKAVSSATILFGQGNTHFVRERARQMGDFRNIVIRNVSTSAQSGFAFREPCRDVLVENVHITGKNENGIAFAENFVAENVTIRNVVIEPDPDYAPDAAFVFIDTPEENLKGLTIENVKVRNEKYIFRGRVFEVGNMEYEEPAEGYFAPERYLKRSAYGRYFHDFYGVEITNRPPDNRFDGTITIEDEY